MNKTTFFIFITAQFLCLSCTTDQENVNYGSNKGTYVSINGKKVYYEEYGKGMPLILLSGGGLSRSIKDFEKCIPELSLHFRVIAPDTPGQGRSEQPDSVTYQSITDTMSQLIDSLEVDSVYIMGWSDGAIVGLLLGERRIDKVKKVIAAGANNGKRGFNIPPGMSLDSVMAPSLSTYEGFNKKVVEEYSKIPGRNWRKLVTDLNKMWYADEYFPPSLYGRIEIPVMILVGDKDDISIGHGLEMHKSIKASHFCVLPNTTHDVFKEQPAVINQLAVDFFKGKSTEALGD